MGVIIVAKTAASCLLSPELKKDRIAGTSNSVTATNKRPGAATSPAVLATNSEKPAVKAM